MSERFIKIYLLDIFTRDIRDLAQTFVRLTKLFFLLMLQETFNLNESLSMMPPLDSIDYGQIDIEDD